MFIRILHLLALVISTTLALATAIQFPLSLSPVPNPGPLPGVGTLSEASLAFLLAAHDDAFEAVTGGGGASGVEFQCVNNGGRGAEVGDVKVLMQKLTTAMEKEMSWSGGVCKHDGEVPCLGASHGTAKMMLCISTPGAKTWPCRLPVAVLETAVSECGQKFRGSDREVGGWGVWVVEQDAVLGGKAPVMLVGRVERVW